MADSDRQNEHRNRWRLGFLACGSLLVAGLIWVAFGQVSDPVRDADIEASMIVTSSGPSTTDAPVQDHEQDDAPSRKCAVGDPADPCHLLDNGTTFDPKWRAAVTLGCGETPDTRVILTFEPETNDRGTATLMWSEPSGRVFQLEVGSEVPSSGRLGWALHGYFLGPWDVDEVADTCVNS